MYYKKRRLPVILALALMFFILVAGALVFTPDGSAQSPSMAAMSREKMANPDSVFETTAACSGSAPVVEGSVTLSNCYAHNLTVGGNARTISVWYSLVTNTVTHDGQNYNHWIANQAQAQAVAQAAEAAWQRYFTDSGHEPYLTGCGDNLNIQMRDGKGWGGIAYWASSGICNIGIDAPNINGGVGDGDRRTIAHEVQHYLQYSYNDGCYADFKPMYPGDSEYVEGYADVGMNSVPGYGDTGYNMMGSYIHLSSMYDKSYGNSFLAYFTQQLGTLGAPADSHYHVDPMYEHYEECDAQDDLYVIDDVIKSLSGGSKDQKWFFVDFFAANYAHDYADPVTQPELVYPDIDDVPTSGPTYSQDVSLSSGSQNWTESTPDDWAARYYRIRPQTGCNFVMLDVETDPSGGEVGINLMATRTSAPTQVLRSAHIGDKATRFFAGAGANDELIVVVNSFDTASTTYDVTATCVVPTLNILEPTQNPGHAMVGAPDSPIATLTRFEVSGAGGLAVSGIISSQITLDAEGDATTIVGNTFQEVGPGEYWAVINPPVKPGGTTWVNYQVCLQGSICDSETDALLYVDPGNTDIALLFDESGSMDTEDTPGEGKRVDNAKKAGKVIPDLLRDGDRILVLGFGAKDDPPGCGLPPDGTGTGNCPPDHKEHLARTDVTVPGTITAAKNAVDLVSARPLWTNIGDALREAKNKLLANPGNDIPDYIFLLSDGRENVLPKYADIKAEIQASGVHINTIGFGPEAPGNLLAQIAAENGGIYRPVATSGLGTSSPPRSVVTDAFTALGMPEQLAEQLAVTSMPFPPGPLGLADVYDYFDTDAQDAARVFHANFLNVPVDNETWYESSAQVDESVTRLRFVVAGKQEDSPPILFRRVEILPPGADPEQGWIPVSPQDPGNPPPASWQIRHSAFDDVVIIPNPDKGLWKIRTMYFCLRCGITLADFMMNGSVQSTVRLEGRLLGLDKGSAMAGDIVPIVATLMTRNGTIPGALVGAWVENEGGVDFVLLLDDGMHYDGQAGDGIYGWPYSLTSHGGSYGVRILALFFDPADTGMLLLREWNGGFWILGPQEEGQDQEDDGMPDEWERRCDLDTNRDDSQEDPDRDGLINIAELDLGTSPCQPDTDRGGELDGSEVDEENGVRNPLWPNDDLVMPVGHVELRPLDQRVWVKWTKPFSYTRMLVHVSTLPDQLGEPFDMGQGGTFTVTRLINGQPYYFVLQGENNGARGAYSDQFVVVPREDPVPPQGAFQIGGPNVTDGGDTAISRSVTLLIDATDKPNYEGPASHSIPHDLVNPQFEGLILPSEDVEMRFSNDSTAIAAVGWEPLAETKPWNLDCEGGETCIVYGQFRDGARNESLVVDQRVTLMFGRIYLPLVNR